MAKFYDSEEQENFIAEQELELENLRKTNELLKREVSVH